MRCFGPSTRLAEEDPVEAVVDQPIGDIWNRREVGLHAFIALCLGNGICPPQSDAIG